jgi:hypothetical protein
MADQEQDDLLNNLSVMQWAAIKRRNMIKFLLTEVDNTWVKLTPLLRRMLEEQLAPNDVDSEEERVLIFITACSGVITIYGELHKRLETTESIEEIQTIIKTNVMPLLSKFCIWLHQNQHPRLDFSAAEPELIIYHVRKLCRYVSLFNSIAH